MDAKVDISQTTLKTPRLLLRPWAMEDLEDFYRYARVEEVGRMAGWPPHEDREVSRGILAGFIREKKVFALQYRENGRVIGSLGLERLSIDLGSPYTHLVGRELGYVLSKDYWGMGLMPEAVQRVIRYCFEEQRYDFLQISHSLTNLRSQRVIQKCGFSFIKEHSRVSETGESRTSRYYLLERGQWHPPAL